MNFTVKTDDISLVGNYSIVFVKKFESLSDALAFTSFRLSVYYYNNTWSTNHPPHFVTALNTQSVELCASQNTSSWKYDLP